MLTWEHLTAVDEALFYTRHDPNDIRLGDVVRRGAAAYAFPSADAGPAHVDVVVVGCPQDEGIRRNKGRAGAALGPAEIRRALYRYALSESHDHLRFFDAGDVLVSGTLEEVHDRLHTVVREALHDGARVVVLGGGNDISYPDCSALAAQGQRVLAINIDKHLDVRADQPRNSGTPYRMLLEEGHVRPELFHEVATNSFNNSRTYREYLDTLGAHIHYLGDLRKGGVGAVVREFVQRAEADVIFWGFDLDVVHAAEAPGVSDPGPQGLTAREVCEIADVAAADPRTRVIEVTEVSPPYDMGNATSKLAANIIVRALARS